MGFQRIDAGFHCRVLPSGLDKGGVGFTGGVRLAPAAFFRQRHLFKPSGQLAPVRWGVETLPKLHARRLGNNALACWTIGTAMSLRKRVPQVHAEAATAGVYPFQGQFFPHRKHRLVQLVRPIARFCSFYAAFQERLRVQKLRL
ncbi:MAG: hypothetical protein KDI44_14670 [Thiothrix sp.]|nr:hypothetical protein [Thiothrix sp.]